MIKKHGGNVHKYAREHGVDKTEIIDFSANINPLGISKKALNQIEKNLEDILNYPDPEYKDLKGAISDFESIDEKKIILEATPDYIYQKTPLEVLPNLNPMPNIIFILRNPAKRLYSFFNFAKNNMGVLKKDISFTEYINRLSDLLFIYARSLVKK